MGEHLADVLMKAADALHWLGQYQVSSALVLLSRLMRARGIATLSELETLTVEVEREMASRATDA